jgi:hypothetical protein
VFKQERNYNYPDSAQQFPRLLDTSPNNGCPLGQTTRGRVFVLVVNRIPKSGTRIYTSTLQLFMGIVYSTIKQGCRRKRKRFSAFLRAIKTGMSAAELKIHN